MNLTNHDIQQIKNKGLTETQVEAQIELFKKGTPFVNLKSAATIDDGIRKVSIENKQKYIGEFEKKRESLDMLKFVPASGAATRMFKAFYNFLNEFDVEQDTINAYINTQKDNELSLFLIGLEKLPFYHLVMDRIREFYPEYDSFSVDKQKWCFIKVMLDEDKLNYGHFPKGLLPFHKYKGRITSAFEEHLFEAALFSSDSQRAKLHFTISESHNGSFDREYERIESFVEEKAKSKFDVSFSYQKGSTDTIAVTMDNEPFRKEDGSMLFRPAGHGALLQNLNEQDADIIFIKNIDNVVVYQYEEEVAKYKKMLAGILLEAQQHIFSYLNELETEEPSEERIFEMANYLSNNLNIVIHEEFEKYSQKYQIEYLVEKLNRPIRVCGMVKNEGEPGGGPFWVKSDSGKVSLQIVEGSQIDKEDKIQKRILSEATHFNPVDLVCGVKDYQGNKFDLSKYVDHSAVFISNKTKDGKELKALELPGLWNGSMAYWNTIFVEVPLVTFNPVKTVVDLLKPAHQMQD
ncbi:DUF4301 family protein [Mangrovimonas aestuarii]|uniref:DUF4301 family protein n=1 Tax=Mangrovimonas aestuarii TaxID=3018443 RepID=UPI002379A1BF|nr:DUF4301 family protein [Mangrovimonas aestuarii]